MDAAQREDAEAPPTNDIENHLKTDFVVAQSSKDFIFIPNPKNHCVTIIDGESLLDAEPVIKSTKCVSCKMGKCVGRTPTYIGIYARGNDAIVLDKGTNQAALIDKARAAENIYEIEVVKGANAIQFAPGGKHAIVYYDPEYVGDAQQDDSSQEITVVKHDDTSATAEVTAKNIVVGAHPRDLVFQTNGEKAFFVTDDGISIIDFIETDDDESLSIAPTVGFQNRLDPKEAQIAIAPGGRYAFGFKPGDNELFQLDITVAYDQVETAESVWSLTMNDFFRKSSENGGNGNNGSGGSSGSDDDAGKSSPVYDFDEDEIDPRPELPEGVVPGISDFAISPTAAAGSFIMVTIPNPGLVLQLSIPAAFKASTTNDLLDEAEFYLIDEKYDRVIISNDGVKAWLYNQEDKSLRTVLLDLSEAPPAMLDEEWPNWASNHVKYFSVAQPITRAEALTGNNAIVAYHEPTTAMRAATSGIGYSIINLDKGVGRFRATAQPIQSFVEYKGAFFVKTEDDPLSSRYEILRTGLEDLLTKSIELKSKPNAIGVLDGDSVQSIFVSHEHPDGYVILLNDEGKVVTNPFIGFQIVNRVQER